MNVGDKIEYDGQPWEVLSFHFDSWDAIYELVDALSKNVKIRDMPSKGLGVVTLHSLRT